MTNSDHESFEQAEHCEAHPTTVPVCELNDSTYHKHRTFDSTADSSLLAPSRVTSQKVGPNRSDANAKGTRKKKKKQKRVLLCEGPDCESNIVVNEDTTVTLDSTSCSPQTINPFPRRTKKSADLLDTKSKTITRKEKKSGKQATNVDQSIRSPSSVTSTDIESPSVSTCQTNVLVLASGVSSCSPTVRKSLFPSTKKKTDQSDVKTRNIRKKKDDKMSHKTGDAADGMTTETQSDINLESCVVPGAVEMHRVQHIHPNSARGSYAIGEPDDWQSDNLTSLIVAAELSPDDEDAATQLAERIERQIKEEVEARLMTQHPTPIIAEAVPDTSSQICGLQRSIWALLSCIVVLLIGAALLLALIRKEDDDSATTADLQYSPSPTSQGTFRPTVQVTSPPVNVKLEELRQELEPWIIRSESDLVPFEDPTSPQSLALEWLSTDLISLAVDRSTFVVLERYVLAVFYFSTDGSNWRSQGMQYMTDEVTCYWNNGLLLNDENAIGVYCDGRSPVHYMMFNEVGISGTLPWELSLLSDLIYLQFNDNALRGVIPTEFSKLHNLERFLVGVNSLTGPLPINLPSSLQYLSFARNFFTGSIPPAWGGILSNVIHFYLDTNELSGPLPSELGQLTTMQVFTIYFNAITGPLPSEFGKLTLMDRLWMNDNYLTGTVPTELAQMSYMKFLAFHANLVTGSVNDIFCLSRDWNVFETDCLADENGLVELECDCCTGCCNADGYCEGV